MKQLVFTKRAKWSYGTSIAVLACGAVLCIFGHDDIGSWIAIGGIFLAVGVAGANGHLTVRQRRGQSKET